MREHIGQRKREKYVNVGAFVVKGLGWWEGEFGGCGILLHITVSLSLQSSLVWSPFLLLLAHRELLQLHHVR